MKLRPLVSGTNGRVMAGLLVLLAIWAIFTSISPSGLPDFQVYEAGPERKKVFFRYTRKLIEVENERIRRDRARLEQLAQQAETGWFDRWWVDSLADQYGLDADTLDEADLVDALLTRVDEVPVSLALAQAAKESAWGTSRFAREANNLFGEWCFKKNCGVVPKNRDPDRRHEVEAFPSPRASVASYLNNINTHDAYRRLRQLRKSLRDAGQELTGLVLADGLARYSERRDEYVEEVKSLIIVNDLEDLRGNSGA